MFAACSMSAMIDDLARAIDAGDASSRDYDLEALVNDNAMIIAETMDGQCVLALDDDDFWSVLPEYLLGIECWAKLDGHAGPWSRITVHHESDLARVARYEDATDEWTAWTDIASMIDAYAAAGYRIIR